MRWFFTGCSSFLALLNRYGERIISEEGRREKEEGKGEKEERRRKKEMVFTRFDWRCGVRICMTIE